MISDKELGQGLFGISDDHKEAFQSLDERFIKNPVSTFFFEAATEAMFPWILKGDILVVDRSISDWNKRVCIVSHEGQLICRRVFKDYSGLTLWAENKKYRPIRVGDFEENFLWGVVIAKIREIK